VTLAGSMPARSARKRWRSGVDDSSPIVADVAMKRRSLGETPKAWTTRRRRSDISAAADPRYVWASSSTIHRSVPRDASRMGASSGRISMYSSMLALVISSGGGSFRRRSRLKISSGLARCIELGASCGVLPL
jgi:hypothetical protein